MELPEGYAVRPLRPEDAGAVAAVMAAHELATIGEVVIEEADIVGDWARPSFDVSTQTIGVFRDETLVGYAEVSGPARGDAAVHPDHTGRGIGAALARWMQDCARARGEREIGMPVPQGSPGETLLRDLGYHERWTSWVLQLPEGRGITEQPLPSGYTLRFAEEPDLEPAYHVVEDAFLEWSVRDKQPFADWSAQILGRPGYAPWNLQVVVDPAGTVVGAVHTTLAPGCGFVDKVAVRRDQRGQGLARALLVAAFTSAREHGGTRSELSTDSRTGALDLYLGLGMEISSTWVNLGIDV